MKSQTIKLSINIKATREKVWDVLLQDETYRIWTSVFHSGSYAEGSWEAGSKILFKTPEGNGLVSKILVHQPCDTISIEHMAVLINGKEDNQDPEAEKWKGLRETYRVVDRDGETVLTIHQDVVPEYVEWFTGTWKKALEKVKELAET